MKASTLLIPVVAIAAFALYMRSRAAGYLNYFVNGVALKWEGPTPIMRVGLVIQNPSNESYEIKSFVGTLSANNETIANVSAFDTVTIPATGQVVYYLYFRMSLLAVVSDIVNLIQKGSGISQVMKLEGALNAAGVLMPVDLTYKIGN